MPIQKTVILILLSLLFGCSDYSEGYRDGIGNSEKRQWLVFGRSAYLDGYFSGQAEKFQQDWLLENPIVEGMMHCPSIVERADPLMFLPAEYSRIGADIYSH